MKNGIIISAFAGLGKTTLGNKYSNILDLESTDYHWVFETEIKNNLTSEELKGIKQRQLNPEWPNNYIKAILEYQTKYDIVLITASKDIRDILDKENIEFIFAFPTLDSLEEIVTRCTTRNNNKQFIDGVKKTFYTWRNELKDYKYKVMLVNKNEYLENALKRDKLL